MGPVFVPILMCLVFKRVSDRFVWIGVAVSFAGVVFIVRPSGLAISTGEVAAILAALAGAGAALVVWALSTTDPPSRQMFYFSFFALLLSALPLPSAWQLPSVPTMLQITFVALFTLIGQTFYSRALVHAAPDKVQTWIYMSIVFAAVIGYAVWDEPIYIITVAGACLVVAGAFLTTRSRADFWRNNECKSGGQNG